MRIDRISMPLMQIVLATRQPSINLLFKIIYVDRVLTMWARKMMVTTYQKSEENHNAFKYNCKRKKKLDVVGLSAKP